MIAFFRSLPKIHDHKWKFFAFFRAKLGGLQKKKGLRQNSEWFFGRNPKFKGFFRPKLGGLQNKKQKKKKGLRQNLDWYFVQIRKFRRFRGGCFRMGEAIFHFSQKIGLKSTKNMRFCILHKSMGGLEPPPPAPPWLRYWASGTLGIFATSSGQI